MTAYRVSANQTARVSDRVPAIARAIRADYARYEAGKAEWKRNHRDASPAEYDAAIRRIATSCGI